MKQQIRLEINTGDLKTIELCLQALLLAYMHYLNFNQMVIEEFLFAEQLKIDIKNLTLYKAIGQFLMKKRISFINVIACATN